MAVDLGAATTAVYFRIDPSRSAEAAHKLNAEAVLHTVIAMKPLQRQQEAGDDFSSAW